MQWYRDKKYLEIYVCIFYVFLSTHSVILLICHVNLSTCCVALSTRSFVLPICHFILSNCCVFLSNCSVALPICHVTCLPVVLSCLLVLSSYWFVMLSCLIVVSSCLLVLLPCRFVMSFVVSICHVICCVVLSNNNKNNYCSVALLICHVICLPVVSSCLIVLLPCWFVMSFVYLLCLLV